jgi:hypothetical protein
MHSEKFDALAFQDEILQELRPVEGLFQAMDAVSPETHGELPRLFAEIGLALTRNLRAKVMSIATTNIGNPDE